MIRLYIKSTIYGFVLGSVLFVIAPLGLGIYIIEVLKPVLVPGLLLTQLLLGLSVGPAAIVIALILNGLLFTLPFLWYFIAQKNSKRG